MLGLLMPLIALLSWLALPASLLCVCDDWLARPRRQLRALAPDGQQGQKGSQKDGPEAAGRPKDPALLRGVYLALPFLLGAAVLRLLLAERLDFSVVLLAVTGAAGLVWLLDSQLLRMRRIQQARAAGMDPAAIPEPGTVDLARSVFPVLLVVLVLRSFAFEPFRIPSDSMMPSLLDGDFILVSKFAYGLRLPVLNTKILATGTPQRGDVVVFIHPQDPSIHLIKRLVGLPGDHVQVHNDRVTINGVPVSFRLAGTFNDGCYTHMQRGEERLGDHTHEALLCPQALQGALTQSSCNRRGVRALVCPASPAVPPSGESGMPADVVVPPGHYFMMGDNRDNSADSRYWGFVPEDHITGKATRIWFNWDLKRSGGPIWRRIGKVIP